MGSGIQGTHFHSQLGSASGGPTSPPCANVLLLCGEDTIHNGLKGLSGLKSETRLTLDNGLGQRTNRSSVHVLQNLSRCRG